MSFGRAITRSRPTPQLISSATPSFSIEMISSSPSAGRGSVVQDPRPPPRGGRGRSSAQERVIARCRRGAGRGRGRRRACRSPRSPRACPGGVSVEVVVAARPTRKSRPYQSNSQVVSPRSCPARAAWETSPGTARPRDSPDALAVEDLIARRPVDMTTRSTPAPQSIESIDASFSLALTTSFARARRRRRPQPQPGQMRSLPAPAVERVVPAAAPEAVGAGLPEEDVVAPVPVDPVVAGEADEDVLAGAAEDVVANVRPPERVRVLVPDHALRLGGRREHERQNKGEREQAEQRCSSSPWPHPSPQSSAVRARFPGEFADYVPIRA